MVFFSVFEKDYRFGNEFRRFREGSLGKMNKIEPKIKLSILPLFQSGPSEQTLIKLFRSVFLSDLFSGLFDPKIHVS